MQRFAKLMSIAMLVAIPSSALAWGQDGHRIIGQIAQERVNGRTAASIEQILGEEDLAEASTWADEERSNPDTFWQTEAGPYHYVTVPIGRTLEAVGSPEEGDGLTALRRFTQTVRSADATQEEKALALRFIVHIVADLHQPLHAGNGSDRGGNDFDVLWFGEETNLHSVWDTKMLEGQNLSYSEYAQWLGRQIEPTETIAWWQPDPLIWIGESTTIRDTIYPQSGEGVARLGYAYQYQHLPTAERRLQQGGVRLAAYLDWLFSDASFTP